MILNKLDEEILETVIKTNEFNPKEMLNLMASKGHTMTAIRDSIRFLIDQDYLAMSINWKLITGPNRLI